MGASGFAEPAPSSEPPSLGNGVDPQDPEDGGTIQNPSPTLRRHPSYSSDDDHKSDAGPPPEFIDPIDHKVMEDPVLLVETGQTYERASILRWFQTCPPGHCTDPLTGTVLKSTEMIPNFALKGLIGKWATRHAIKDLHCFSMKHSRSLRQLASSLGRVQLSPRRASPSPGGAASAVAAGDGEGEGEVGGTAPPPENGQAEGNLKRLSSSLAHMGGTDPEGEIRSGDYGGRAAGGVTAPGSGTAAAGCSTGSEGSSTIREGGGGQAPRGQGGWGSFRCCEWGEGGASPLPPLPHPANAGPHAELAVGDSAAASDRQGVGGGEQQEQPPYPAVLGGKREPPHRKRPSPFEGAGHSSASLPPPSGGASRGGGSEGGRAASAGAAVPSRGGGDPLGDVNWGGEEGGGVYPSASRPARTMQDKLRDVAASMQALQPAQLVSGGKGAASYHAWTLRQLALDEECKGRMLQGRAVPLVVYLLGQPGLEEARPALAGLLHRLSVTGPAVVREVLTAGGVHALVGMVSSEDKRQQVAACTALYFMGWLTQQIKWAVASSLAQQAQQQGLPPNPLYALWRLWDPLPPPPPAHTPSPSPLPSEPWLDLGGEVGPVAELQEAPLKSLPAPEVPAELHEEWEALAYLTHMLTSAPGSGPAGSAPLSLDVRASGIPQVLAHVACSRQSSEASRYAALCSFHALAQLPQHRTELLGPLVEWLGGADWEMAAAAAETLWELAYEEGAGNSFPVLQVLQATPQLVPCLSAALSRPLPPLRRASIGLLACLLYDGTGHAGSGASASVATTQRYCIVDGWRQALLAPGSTAVQSLLQAVQGSGEDPPSAALALTALANLAAARGTSTGGKVAAPPHPRPSTLDKLSARLQEKLHGAKAERGTKEGEQVAPGPRGAMLSTPSLIPALLSLVVSPTGGGVESGAPSATGGGSAAFGSGSFASLSPPGTPGSARSLGGATSFSFTPIGQLAGGGRAADTQSTALAILPPALLALCNLSTERHGREQVRGWARGHPSRRPQLQAALTAAMGNRQLPLQAQELARRLLHELSAVSGPLQLALGCLPAATAPRAAAYPSP